MTTYVCPSCRSVYQFMSLAVLCAETHPIGAGLERDGTQAAGPAPVVLQRVAT